jgi:hypothetical protein
LGDLLNEVGVCERHLLPEGSVDAPSSLSHLRSRPAPVARVVVPGVVGACVVRELMLRRCFGPSNSDVGVTVVVGVVVAWPSSVTDVTFGSTSGSRCRACDAPRGCFAAWASAAASIALRWHLRHRGYIS